MSIDDPRILLESLEKRIKNQRKEERRIKKEKKREKEKKRNDEKKQRKAIKEKAKAKKEKDNKKITKSPKQKKETKTITVEGSDDDSCGKFKFWWSVGIEEDKKKTKTKKTTRIVNKIPKAKKKGKTKGVTVEGCEISLSEHDLTETTAHSSLGSSQSHNWFVTTLMGRKITEDRSEDTTNHTIPMWWDVPPLPSTLSPKSVPLPATPIQKKIHLPLLVSPSFDLEAGIPLSATPTPKQKKGYLPPLLSPSSYSDSDSFDDDVSMCSEESMSEQMLDDLSCILECEDDDCVFELSSVKDKRLRVHLDCESSLNNNKRDSDSRWSVVSTDDRDSSSIFSAPLRLSPLRKASSFDDNTDDGPKHLGGIKVLASRKNNDQDADTAAGTYPSRNMATTIGKRLRMDGSIAATDPPPLNFSIDGIIMIHNPDLFPKRKI
jgi:hypothetical protein